MTNADQVDADMNSEETRPIWDKIDSLHSRVGALESCKDIAEYRMEHQHHPKSTKIDL